MAAFTTAAILALSAAAGAGVGANASRGKAPALPTVAPLPGAPDPAIANSAKAQAADLLRRRRSAAMQGDPTRGGTLLTGPQGAPTAPGAARTLIGG